MEQPRTVVVALDKKPASEAALKWALDNFIRPTDKIMLCTVASPQFPYARAAEEYVTMRGRLAWNEDEMREATTLGGLVLDRYVAQLAESGHDLDATGSMPATLVPSLGGVTAFGPNVCTFASSVGASCIVVGEPGKKRGLLSRASEAAWMVTHSRVPVICVPGPPPGTLAVTLLPSATTRPVHAPAARAPAWPAGAESHRDVTAAAPAGSGPPTVITALPPIHTGGKAGGGEGGELEAEPATPRATKAGSGALSMSPAEKAAA